MASSVYLTVTEQDRDLDESGYNGWANYPTWTAAAWLGSEQPRAEAVKLLLSSLGDVKQGADSLESWIEDENPLADIASLYSDLLTWALNQIDWDEVARGLGPEASDETGAGDDVTGPEQESVAGHVSETSPDSTERTREFNRTLERLGAGELHCPDCASTLSGQTLYIGGVPEIRLVCPKEECGFETL